MNDHEAMLRSRINWVRELGKGGGGMPSEQALAAYHRGFIDALSVALGRVVNEEARRTEERAPQPDPFREAVHALVDKMEACHADPKYKSVWVINQIHTGEYTGPNYATELAAVKGHMRSVGGPHSP